MKHPKTRKKAEHGTLLCADCSTEVVKNSASQRYCSSCSTKRDIERKRLHALDRGKKVFNEKRAAWAENGKELSRTERKSLIRAWPESVDWIWWRRVQVPFSWAGSKNHIFSTNRRGHTFMRDEARYYRSLIASRIRASVDIEQIVQNKLWIDIFVQKPNHRGDAGNFVDLIFDAVKDAIPLDDRWYSIRQLDWQIVKDDPQIYIGLSQNSNKNVQACSTCGRLQEYHLFQKNKATTNGIGRVCRECQSIKAATRRKPKMQGAFA